MKDTRIEVNKWNAQKIIQMMEIGQFDPSYMETPVDWYRLSKYGKISESLIDKYAEYWDWSVICLHQKLSEEFIRNHFDNIQQCMYELCISQELSVEFIQEYQDIIKWNALARNEHLTLEIIHTFYEKLAAYLEIKKEDSQEL